MCGISAIVSLGADPIPALEPRLRAMNALLRHRGPDGEGVWTHPSGRLGFGHRRLTIIDLTTGDQPMTDGGDNWITYNGEIYNYRELRDELGASLFRTTSDTEAILRAYRRWGADCLDHLRGMFAFALWDEKAQRLLCARDRFGIKPFYYAVADGTFYCASEVKALLPFLPAIELDLEGIRDYLAFQFCLDGKTPFKGVRELLPGHRLTVQNGAVRVDRYWEVHYETDFDHTFQYFEGRLGALIRDSVDFHLRADVPVGAYLSGGVDSSIIASLASERVGRDFQAFTGKFTAAPGYDESRYARDVAARRGFALHEIDITARDFIDRLGDVIYHLDFPVAGPGSFPQFMVSGLAARHMKVVLGGQGGDEIFGGYARYLIAYFEQCIKAAIDGTTHSGNFVVTYESIIPNLATLRQYKPLLQEFWAEGLFGELDERYFRLINRSNTMHDVIDWDALGDHAQFDTFRRIFRAGNVKKESYFDSMTHFDFKTLLPALLQVEDRMSMAHGLESRVPFLDHPIVEFTATFPSDVKFKNGELKHILREAMGRDLPDSIRARKDKMGFPVPLQEWMHGDVREFVRDVFASPAARHRPYLKAGFDADSLIRREGRFSRALWGLLCLELWQQRFHDRAAEWRSRAPSLEPPRVPA